MALPLFRFSLSPTQIIITVALNPIGANQGHSIAGLIWEKNRICLCWWLFVGSIISWICVPYTAPHNGPLIAIGGRWRQITRQGMPYTSSKRNTQEQSCFFGEIFMKKKFPTPPSSCRQHLISGRKRQSQHVLFSHYPWKFAKEKTWEKLILLSSNH